MWIIEVCTMSISRFVWLGRLQKSASTHSEEGKIGVQTDAMNEWSRKIQGYNFHFSEEKS